MNKQLSAVFLVLEINYSSFYKSSFGPSHDNGENVIKEYYREIQTGMNTNINGKYILRKTKKFMQE